MELTRMLYNFRTRWLSTAARRMTLVVCVAALLGSAVFTQFFRLEKKMETFRAGALGRTETFYLPPNLDVLRFAALGHEQFLADMLFVRGYGYFLAHLFSDRVFSQLRTFIDAIIYLDPYNPDIYRWASQMVKYGQEITQEAVDASIAYSKMGIERFPNDWRFYMDVGFNLFFEYKWYENEAEQQKLKDEALEYFTIAANLPNSNLDPNFLTELYARKNDTRMALFQAYRAYNEASERERRYLRRRVAQLESNAAARELEEEEEGWRESFPFLPFALYQLLGSPNGGDAWAELVDSQQL